MDIFLNNKIMTKNKIIISLLTLSLIISIGFAVSYKIANNRILNEQTKLLKDKEDKIIDSLSIIQNQFKNKINKYKQTIDDKQTIIHDREQSLKYYKSLNNQLKIQLNDVKKQINLSYDNRTNVDAVNILSNSRYNK